MKNYKILVSLTETEQPAFIKNNKNYNPTLEFRKTYNISEKDIETYEIKLNKFLSKNQWSSKNAIIQSIAIEKAFDDGLSPQGNLVNYKINN